MVDLPVDESMVQPNITPYNLTNALENPENQVPFSHHLKNEPVGRAVPHSFLEREIWGSNHGLAKSDTALPVRNDAEMGPANSLLASA